MPIKNPPRKILKKISNKVLLDEKEEIKNELTQLLIETIVKWEKLKLKKKIYDC